MTRHFMTPETYSTFLLRFNLLEDISKLLVVGIHPVGQIIGVSIDILNNFFWTVADGTKPSNIVSPGRFTRREADAPFVFKATCELGPLFQALWHVENSPFTWVSFDVDNGLRTIPCFSDWLNQLPVCTFPHDVWPVGPKFKLTSCARQTHSTGSVNKIKLVSFNSDLT